MGLNNDDLPHQMDKNHWPEMKQRFADIFESKTRDQWCEIYEGTNACVAPILKMSEVHHNEHIKA